MKTILIVGLLLGFLGCSLAMGGILNLPSYIQIGTHTFSIPAWISNQPCPKCQGVDVELISGELNEQTLTLVMRCRTCGEIYFNAIVNQETIKASQKK